MVRKSKKTSIFAKKTRYCWQRVGNPGVQLVFLDSIEGWGLAIEKWRCNYFTPSFL